MLIIQGAWFDVYGISDIKIVQKSSNPKEDVFYFGGSGMRCISAYSE